jgi:hypothetical protein
MNNIFFNAYLTDLHLICENKNFSAKFNMPESIKSMDNPPDAEEIECQILNKINKSNLKDKFNEVFDSMNIDENNLEKFEINFHFNHDDFTEKDKESLIAELETIITE